MNRACYGALVVLLSLSAVAAAAGREDLGLCIRGWDATEAGHHAEAIQLYGRCIKGGNLTRASLARTYRNLGIAYRRSGDPDKAVDALGKAIALHPADVWDDYVNRGNAYSDKGEFERAFENYDLALEANPGYGEAYYNRGIVFERQNEFEKAKAEFVRAYDHGLRSELLYERYVAYGLAKKAK